MDDARNNPAIDIKDEGALSDSGERVAGTSPATPRDRLPWGKSFADVAESLSALENVVQFAYENGYHEHGVPLVRIVREYILDAHDRIAELRKDAARLDWLEATENEVLIDARYAREPDSRFVTVRQQRMLQPYHSGPTLRAALDAAMSAPTPKAEV